MNRRDFIKRTLTALGLAIAWPLMPSVGRAEKVVTWKMIRQEFPSINRTRARIEYSDGSVGPWTVNVLHYPFYNEHDSASEIAMLEKHKPRFLNPLTGESEWGPMPTTPLNELTDLHFQMVEIIKQRKGTP